MTMLTIDGKSTKCLIDSGSAISIGDISFFSGNTDIRPLNKCILIKTLLGSQVISEEAIVGVPSEFRRDDETMSLKLLQLKDKSFDCILGINILQQLKIILDFCQNKMFVGNEAISFIGSNESVDCEQACESKKRNEWCVYATKFDFCAVDKNNFNTDLLISDDLNSREKQVLSEFLNKNRRLFYQEGQKLSATTCVHHKIITKPHNPVYTKNFRYPYALEGEINRQIDEMLDNGVIRPSKSPYNSPLWIVEKKAGKDGNKKWRLVIDFRKLNELTVDDKFPIPNIESLFDKLGRANYFSTLDLAKGFHQIPMDPVDVEKTAFSSSKGHFEFIRMPFGLKNAPATFQRMINGALSEHINKCCVIYMDDILVFSSSLEEHIESLNKIFKCLYENNLKLQFDKCIFLSRHTNFLGHIITPTGIKPSMEKLEAIRKVTLPTSVKQIKSFLGLTGYYRKFIQNYSHIAAPIIKYLKKDAKIDINDAEYNEAFEKLKRILTNPPLLAFPNFGKKFVLTTDSSDLAIGAVLSQEGKPIGFASRTLNGHEMKYHINEKELLAMVWAVNQFRPYLYGRRFLVQTDNQPLKSLYSRKEPSPRVLRWKMLLEEYDFDIELIRGKENTVADYLSRPNLEGDAIEVAQVNENSAETIHSASEDSSEYFLISEFIVNKYFTQIRLVQKKEKDVEKMYKDKYTIIYLEPKDINRNSYLTDLFRKYIVKGKIGIYSEWPYQDYNIIQKKLISMFANSKISFTLCKVLAVDVKNKEELLESIEQTHVSGNHRGINENYEQLKWKYFFPNLQKFVTRFINSCQVCNENKHERHPIKKQFHHTFTPERPNEIVHVDIFSVSKILFFTTIDKFTKMATAHKLSDKNMCTVIIKLQERIAWLGKPEKIVFDNEFNNSLIKLFCSENNIEMHFTTPHSHTGNSDVERLHSTLLEHIRIIKNNNNELENEEIVIRAVGFYNNTIHSTTRLKPLDFLNTNIDYKEVKDRMQKNKINSIERINKNRDVIDKNKKLLYIKNPLANRNKTAKRYVKLTKSYPNKIDLAQVRRPTKTVVPN